MFIVWRVELLARVADNDLANINPSPFAPILRSVKVVFTIKALQIPFYCLKIVNGSKMNLDRKFRGLLWALCRVILRQFPIPPLSPIIFCEMLRLFNFAVSHWMPSAIAVAPSSPISLSSRFNSSNVETVLIILPKARPVLHFSLNVGQKIR